MSRIKLSIIIVNYRSRVYLEKCLTSIFTKIDSGVSFEVLVVNNGLRDETDGLEIVFPGLKIIQSQKNNGFGNANNLGAKEAQGEIIFFLNPDTEIVSQKISAVIREFESDSNLGILGSKVVSPDGSVQKWIFGSQINLWSILGNNIGLSQDEKKYCQSEKPVEVFWVSGTAFFIRRELFNQLGGFDERFFLYFEDVDICNRTHLLGKKVVYFSKFSVLHHGGKSFSQKKKQKEEYYLAQDYYFQKHRGFFEALFLKVLRFFSF